MRKVYTNNYLPTGEMVILYMEKDGTVHDNGMLEGRAYAYTDYDFDRSIIKKLMDVYEIEFKDGKYYAEGVANYIGYSANMLKSFLTVALSIIILNNKDYEADSHTTGK